MVLVGHSMGGLVAQLQVTCSSDVLWRHAANRPLEEVRTTPQMREQLQRMFFFGPSPLVKRVVFIATPHRGSGMSRRLIGRVAAGLVRYSGPEKAQYEQLMDGNRDIFKQYLWKSRPTTIDLLEPDNPMLAAMARMSFGCGVRTHSIIGTGRRTLAGEPSDGVVPVSSARQAGDCSELHVSARHDKLHRDPATVAELTRILREHVLRAKTREF
jgi:pimeloyl-ACP methyl ester carboxylesterase